MKKAIIYTRVSGKEQLKGTSLEVQEDSVLNMHLNMTMK